MTNMHHRRPKVLVLLSTWNGARYLAEQIDSLLTQELEADLQIVVRDDGSSDGTLAYLQSITDPRVRIEAGNNIGARASFFALLRAAQQSDADYVALCDQDDVWRPSKLARALARLDPTRPGLYASALDLVDGDLQPLGRYIHPGNRTFAATLLVNFATGCTCVMTAALLRGLPFPEDERQVLMHDWWLASVATLAGEVVYDPESAIAYRQHGGNHVGIKTGVRKIAAKLYDLRRSAACHGPSRFDHARQLLAAAGDRLSAQHRAILHAFLKTEHSRRRRMVFVLSNTIGVDVARRIMFVVAG